MTDRTVSDGGEETEKASMYRMCMGDTDRYGKNPVSIPKMPERELSSDSEAGTGRTSNRERDAV